MASLYMCVERERERDYFSSHETGKSVTGGGGWEGDPEKTTRHTHHPQAELGLCHL